MDDLYAYLMTLPPNTKLKDVVLNKGTSLEAAMPVAQAPERKRMWGNNQKETNYAAQKR